MLDTPKQHALRKDEHVLHALDQYQERSTLDFQHTRFIHHSLPQMDMTDVDLTTTLDSLRLSTPFFINAMTGGSPKTEEINAQLAHVAKETGLMMATGSMSIALKDPSTANGFSNIRTIYPNGTLLANLGAHHSVDNAKKAIDILQADGLQIHVNTVQELIMPEGERSFTNWLQNIENITNQLNIPVIVKEVGFGMSKETISQLYNVGVTLVDVSGKGGTNFAKIENARRNNYSLSQLDDWGQTTLESLLEATALPTNKRPTIIASGGIKSALDIAKCLALGANAVGLSGHFLTTLQNNGVDYTIQYVHQLKEQLQTIMTLLGARTIKDLQQSDIILAPSLQHYKTQRGL